MYLQADQAVLHATLSTAKGGDQPQTSLNQADCIQDKPCYSCLIQRVPSPTQTHMFCSDCCEYMCDTHRQVSLYSQGRLSLE